MSFPVPYATYFGDISPNVPGVPDAVLGFYMNKVMIDLCDRAKVARVSALPVSLVPCTYVNGAPTALGQIDYAPILPQAYCTISAILSAKIYMTNAQKWYDIPSLTTEQIFATQPDWPNYLNPGQPSAVTQKDEQYISIVPAVSNADTFTLYLFVAIRPTVSSTFVDPIVYESNRRAIYHGTLHELMSMPKRPWTDEKRAQYHGKQWEYMVNLARARANKSFSRANISVVPSPWA
jgi:hypothetical protein